MIKAIPEWRRAWRMLSVQVAALMVAWSALPEPVQASILGLLGIPPGTVTAVLGLGVILGRLIEQPKVRQ